MYCQWVLSATTVSLSFVVPHQEWAHPKGPALPRLTVLASETGILLSPLPGKEGVCKHSGVSFSASVLPERFEESPLSKSLWGPSVVPLQARGSQEG